MVKVLVMKVASTISPEFLSGFVDQCTSMGMDLNGTEELLHKHCNNAVFTRPDVYEGFRGKIASFTGNKAKLARCLTPDMISFVEDVRLRYGDDPLSEQLRDDLDLPEPSWDNVPDNVKTAALKISRVIDDFDYLPIGQKVLIASLVDEALVKSTQRPN